MAQSTKHENTETTSNTKQTIAYLEEISLLIIQLSNARDFKLETPAGALYTRHIAPECVFHIDGFSGGVSHAEMNEVYAEWANSDPRMEFRPVSVSTQIDLPQGLATVFLQFLICGWMGNHDVEVKTFGELSWKLYSDGQWRFYKARYGVHVATAAQATSAAASSSIAKLRHATAMPNGSERTQVDELHSNTRDLAVDLEKLSLLLLTVMNKRDFELQSEAGLMFKRHIANDYVAYLDSVPEGLTFDQFNRHWRDMACQCYPKMEFRPTSVWADVDEVRGQATVHTEFVMRGWLGSPNMVDVKGFGRFSWRRDATGHWEIWEYHVMRSGVVDDGT